MTVLFTVILCCAVPPEESAFNGGAGTQKEPYLIKTESAFLALDRFDTEGKYYELAADIAITQKRTASFVIEKEFSGVLSGGTAQHKITVNKTVNEENDLYLFKRLASATIRNLKLEFKANTAVTLALCAYGNNLFSNVDVYGKMHFSENDQCVYLQHNYDLTEDLKNVGERGAKTLFEYCDNYANVTSIANMGIFVGFANYLTFNEGENLGYLTLKNCKNYGTVSARNVGMLFSNATTPYVYNVTATNAINEGVINYLECGTPIGGAGYPDLPFEQMAYEIVADNVDNGANGQIEPIDALNATVNAKNKVSCFFSASVKKVIFVFEYQASVSYGEGIKYIRHVESVLTDAAATSVASSAEVASIVPLPAATVQTKGYRFIYDNEWRTETYNDVVCYIHSNGISFDSTLEQTVPAEDLNVYAFAYDASGTLLSATKVQ